MCRGHRFRPNFDAEGAPRGALSGVPIWSPIWDHFGGPDGPKTDPGGAPGAPKRVQKGHRKSTPKMDRKWTPKWTPNGPPKGPQNGCKKCSPQLPAEPPLFSFFQGALGSPAGRRSSANGPREGPRRPPGGPQGPSEPDLDAKMVDFGADSGPFRLPCRLHSGSRRPAQGAAARACRLRRATSRASPTGGTPPDESVRTTNYFTGRPDPVSVPGTLGEGAFPGPAECAERLNS